MVPCRFFDSFLDTAEPQPVAPSRGIQADAVVGHRHLQPIVVTGHVHLDGACLRVPDAVGQRFLDRLDTRTSDSDPAGRRSLREPQTRCPRRTGGSGRARATRAPAAGRSRRACSAGARARDRARCGTSDPPGDGIPRPPRRRAASSARPGALDPAELHPQGGEHLRDVVVELARQIRALLFLSGDQPLRQLAHLALGVLRDRPLLHRNAARGRATGRPRSARQPSQGAGFARAGAAGRREIRLAAASTSARCSARLALFSSSISCAIASTASRRGTTSRRRKLAL